MAEHTNTNFETDAIHAGQSPDQHSGAVITPISLSTTFQQHSPGEFYPGAYEYARTGNPTRDAYEQCVAALEKGKWGVSFSSGLASIMTILHMLESGAHVLSMNDVYGGTYRYFTTIASKFGITFDFADFSNLENVTNGIKENTKIVWFETPSNPTLTVVDIKAVVDAVRATGRDDIIIVVDNTFLSPFFQNPLTLGADLVIHSVSKYINGHSDVIGGIVLGNSEDLRTRLKYLQNSIGAIPSPFDSFLVLRGLKTLHVRMERHASNAKAVADYLRTHDKVSKVIFCDEKHAQADIVAKQTTGPGGIITFFVKGELPQCRQFLENLSVFALAESLGGVESLVDHPVIMTHAAVPKVEREKLGISDSLVRLSVGIENIDDLIGDLEHALSCVTL